MGGAAVSRRIQHVTPVADEREHELSPHCWCGPDAEAVDGSMLYVHHAADLRETYEEATGEAFKGRTWDRVEVEEEP
jgi:hypothetical protein